MNKLYKQEQKHVDKSRKNLIAAEFILLTMDKSEFDLFLSKLKSDTKKLGFVPSNDAVSQTWNYKGEGLSDTNSLLYRRLLKAKEKKIVLITLGILFLLIVVVSFVIYLVVKYY